jgi:hypothetical protein
MPKSGGDFFYLLWIFRELAILRRKKPQPSMAKKGLILWKAAVWLNADKTDSLAKVHSRTYGIKAKCAGVLRRDHNISNCGQPLCATELSEFMLASSPFPHL